MKIECIRNFSTNIKNGDIFDIIKKDDERITTHQLDFDNLLLFLSIQKRFYQST